jgi:hypothetical protein
MPVSRGEGPSPAAQSRPRTGCGQVLPARRHSSCSPDWWLASTRPRFASLSSRRISPSYHVRRASSDFKEVLRCIWRSGKGGCTCSRSARVCPKLSTRIAFSNCRGRLRDLDNYPLHEHARAIPAGTFGLLAKRNRNAPAGWFGTPQPKVSANIFMFCSELLAHNAVASSHAAAVPAALEARDLSLQERGSSDDKKVSTPMPAYS